MDDLEKIRDGLREMPVPEPRPGFEDRVLERATAGGRTPQAPGNARAKAPSVTWFAVAASVLTAVLVWSVMMWVQGPRDSSVVLALNESREVSLVIDSERDLEGASIRIFVTGSVALAGYEGQQEIQWLTSLTQGANLLSLPVVARKAGEGHVIAEIEHQGRTRRVSVTMRVTAQGDIA